MTTRYISSYDKLYADKSVSGGTSKYNNAAASTLKPPDDAIGIIDIIY